MTTFLDALASAAPRIKALREAGNTNRLIAQDLNAAGLRNPCSATGGPWTAADVDYAYRLLRRNGGAA